MGRLIEDLEGSGRSKAEVEGGDSGRAHLASTFSDAPSDMSVRSTVGGASVPIASGVGSGAGSGAGGDEGPAAGVTHGGAALTVMSPAAQRCYDFLGPMLRSQGRQLIYVVPPGAVTGFSHTDLGPKKGELDDEGLAQGAKDEGGARANISAPNTVLRFLQDRSSVLTWMAGTSVTSTTSSPESVR